MSWACTDPGWIARRILTRQSRFADMIRTLTTEWFWGAGTEASRKTARGVASSRMLKDTPDLLRGQLGCGKGFIGPHAFHLYQSE